MTTDGILFIVKSRIDRERLTSPADRIRKVALMHGVRGRKRMAKVVSPVPFRPIVGPSFTSPPNSARTGAQGSEQEDCSGPQSPTLSVASSPHSQTPAANASVASTITLPEPDPTAATTFPGPDEDSIPSDRSDDNNDDNSSFTDENGFSDESGGFDDMYDSDSKSFPIAV